MPLFANGFPDDRERLPSYFAIRGDVVRTIEVELVDFPLRDELIDFDGPRALKRNGVELVGIKLDVAFADLVSVNDGLRWDFVAGLDIDPLVLDAVAGLFIELVEADFFALAARRVEGDRADTRESFRNPFQ
jgi:hypothetical protein